MWHDDQEEDDYLAQNPAFERSLWKDWVQTLCSQKKMAQPNSEEWSALDQKWYSGKAPLQSLDELRQLRTEQEQRTLAYEQCAKTQASMQAAIESKLSPEELRFLQFKSVEQLLNEKWNSPSFGEPTP